MSLLLPSCERLSSAAALQPFALREIRRTMAARVTDSTPHAA